MSRHVQSDPHLPSPWAVGLGMTGLFGFALFAFFGIAVANIGIALMLVAVFLDRRRFWRALRGDPILLLLVWTMIAVGLSAGMRSWEFPEESADQLDGAEPRAAAFLLLAGGLVATGASAAYLVDLGAGAGADRIRAGRLSFARRRKPSRSHRAETAWLYLIDQCLRSICGRQPSWNGDIDATLLALAG